MAVLFDGQRERDGFSYVALLRLMRRAKRLLSWGDGAISNGDWFLKAPEALGILGYLFDTEKEGRRLMPAKPYGPILEIEDQQPDRITGRNDGGAYVLERSGVTLKVPDLDDLLAVFGAGVADMQGVELLAAEFADAVLLRRKGQVLGALMDSKAEARRTL